MTYRDLTPDTAHSLLRQDASIRILDVRTAGEHDSHRIDGALLLPVQEIHWRHSELSPDHTYLVTCEHGVRSVAACEFLAALGYQRLLNLTGGMARWIDAGLPFVGRSAKPG